jgi:hypothetical protein
MANVNVSVTADQTPTTVVIVPVRTINPSEGTDISSNLGDRKK